MFRGYFFSFTTVASVTLMCLNGCCEDWKGVFWMGSAAAIPQPWLLFPASPFGSRWYVVACGPAIGECRAGGMHESGTPLCSEPLNQAGIQNRRKPRKQVEWHGLALIHMAELLSFPSPKVSILTYRHGLWAVLSSRPFLGEFPRRQAVWMCGRPCLWVLDSFQHLRNVFKSLWVAQQHCSKL